ncbi:uncharacterized protein LOC120353389 [Nilaparvata lugens]|uniref:uncharacterized protein LOC120353389 n=1 Tax=Nilaparvata lugens TaxID=108931 RepID=UPI00193D1787|nr:uncharacterized protein LOC120353389 [Nilaparvata lugens]
MRRMAEINQARSEACQENSTNDNLKSESCDNMTRIAEESELTDVSSSHTTNNISTEEPDSSLERPDFGTKPPAFGSEFTLTNYISTEEPDSSMNRPDSSTKRPDFGTKRPETRSEFAFNCLTPRELKCDFKFGEDSLTPSDVECSDGARDLIQRLLNPDPQRRLRSLLSLQSIRFFKDFDFASVRTKKISPKEVLLRLFPDGPKTQQSTESTAYFFEDFDSIHI